VLSSGRPDDRPMRCAATSRGAVGAGLFGLVILIVGCVAPAGPAGSGVDQTDPRFAACGGATTTVIAAFPMAAAREYHVHLPQMGLSPELDVASPAFVVVFAGMWPGPDGGGAAPPPGTTWPPRSLAPGTHDVCIWVGDATTGSRNVYEDVSTAGMAP
jgi:hypothetical protein